MILEHLSSSGVITNEKVQELCGFTRQQAKETLSKMREERHIDLIGKGRGSKYVLVGQSWKWRINGAKNGKDTIFLPFF